MKSFGQFLFEATFAKNDSGGWSHHASIDGHHVHVHFIPHQVPHSYEAHVESENHEMHPSTRAKIASHIIGVTHHFIREKKPETLHIKGDKHAAAWLAGHLAQKHSGKVDSDNAIHFHHPHEQESHGVSRLDRIRHFVRTKAFRPIGAHEHG